MSDETNSEVVKVEAAPEVAAEVETKPDAEFFDVFEENPAVVFVEPLEPASPTKPEPPVEPACEHSFEYAGHKVEFSASGDCFIKKDGECLGLPAGVFKSEADAEDFIDQREAEKGE
jgi:hypothetical protein